MQNELLKIFATIPELELVVLIGSRANNTFQPNSDWDFAIQWVRSMGFIEQLAATEQLRKTVAETLGTSDTRIDLIHIPTARLAMRAVIAEEGLILKGAENIAWHRFLQRTWRELEEHYWEQTYAA